MSKTKRENRVAVLDAKIPLSWQLPDEWGEVNEKAIADMPVVDRDGVLFPQRSGRIHVHIMRALVLDKTKRMVLVFNKRDARPGSTRPPGWGQPGGVVNENESPLQAFLRHEKGEIPWPIIDRQFYLHTELKDREDRLEHIHFFLAFCDEERQVPLTAREALDIGEATLEYPQVVLDGFDQRGNYLWPEVVTTDGAPHRPPEDHAIYKTHLGFIRRSWAQYQRLRLSTALFASGFK